MTDDSHSAPAGTDLPESLQPDRAVPSDIESVDSVLQAHEISEEIRTVVQAVLMEYHSGPLPPPRMLAQYDEVVPGLADRIVSMAESQTKHRISIETTSIEGDVRRSEQGLSAGRVVAIAGLVAATIMVVAGEPWAGGIVGTLDIGTLVATFIYGTERRRSERIQKARLVEGPQQ